LEIISVNKSRAERMIPAERGSRAPVEDMVPITDGFEMSESRMNAGAHVIAPGLEGAVGPAQSKDAEPVPISGALAKIAALHRCVISPNGGQSHAAARKRAMSEAHALAHAHRPFGLARIGLRQATPNIDVVARLREKCHTARQRRALAVAVRRIA